MKNRSQIPRRVKLLVVAFLVMLLAAALSVHEARGQGQLTLGDFDDTGLDADVLALLEVGSSPSGAWTVFYRPGSSIGSLLDGEVGLGTQNSTITDLRWQGGSINQLRMENGADLDLSAYFGTGGAGADLLFRVQTADGSGTGAIGQLAANNARFLMDTDAQTLLDGLSSGDRLILALTRTAQRPNQVTGVNATAASDVSITVTWNAADRADAYTVEWGTASGSYTDSATAAASPYAITGLTPNTLYYVRVTATRADTADGTPSAEANARTNAPPQPAQVTGVNASGISDSEIQVTWSSALHATGYVVQWSTDSAFSDPGSAQVDSAGVIIERLTPETEYFVRVYGTRAGAPNGPVSAANAATTLDSRIHVLIDRAPGGPVAVQLGLAIFSGVLASTRAKGMKSPQREAAITGAMSFGALILPFFGQGNNFWIIGIALLVLLSSIATIFIASRR